ncbi:MAG: methylenetetrahydrofolate reductase [NAD(P)H] [Candidatus Margulisiibacteriota bacterium]|jgi:methylenetetrahydrofolate reductase (NADPH)
MKLKDIYAQGKTVITFEVFPPKTDEGVANLMAEMARLKKFNPAFISVTYGAGGSNQGRSLQVTRELMEKLGLPVMPHFTCVGSSREYIQDFIQVLADLKIENILALRGDPPRDKTNFDPGKTVFKYANELVEFLKQNSSLDIGVAGYPEGHQENKQDLDRDFANLQKKMNAGASLIVSQMFFDNEKFYAFAKKARANGMNQPIIPGILPITNLDSIEKMIELSGAEVPKKLLNDLQSAKDEPEKVKAIGIEHAVQQIKDLLAFGVPGIHFYTLNKSEVAEKVLGRIIPKADRN